MSAKPLPPIPDQPQVFCNQCQRWKPRAAIASARWVRGGQRAIYCCQACKDNMASLTKGPRRGG